jgi:hypothetical protein
MYANEVLTFVFVWPRYPANFPTHKVSNDNTKSGKEFSVGIGVINFIVMNDATNDVCKLSVSNYLCHD